jgi:glycosyltransferase involved in cell wall biosynthesis
MPTVLPSSAAPWSHSPPLRISHIITGLGVGGAEAMLLKVLQTVDREQFPSHVISLSGDATLARDIRDGGIPVDVLDLPPSTSRALSAVWRVMRLLRAQRPDVVQTWLFHADLVGGIAAKCLRLPVVWNIQAGSLDASGTSRRTTQVVRACGLASRVVPRVIVSCSSAGVAVHKALGYADKFRVIPNGIDLTVFTPDAAARRHVRSDLGLAADVPVIGMVARFHPQKDHANFLDAAEDLIRTHPHVRFALCGLGLDPANQDLMALITSRHLDRHTHLIGLRRDIPRVMNAFDIHTLSSAFSEGFPNVLGEAMATGVPCVVTDVGDSALIVGETGISVAPRNPRALADGWRALLDLPPARFAALGAEARRQIATRFSLTASVAQYLQLYREVASGRG